MMLSSARNAEIAMTISVAGCGPVREPGRQARRGGATTTSVRRARALSDATAWSYRRSMRIESSVTSISWIPSEAIEGMTKMPFETGVAHYDLAPPEAVDGPETIDELRIADRF